MSTAAAEPVSAKDQLDALGMLELLKTIAAGEAGAGHESLERADKAADPAAADTIRFVAAREFSHAEIFARRVAELGAHVDIGTIPAPSTYRPASNGIQPDPNDSGRAHNPTAETFLAEFERRVAEGGYFDPLTAQLMSWFVAEERDSQARLRSFRDWD